MTALSPDRLVAELKRYGVPVNEQPGWRTRTAGGSLDVRVVGVHDTVTGAMTDASAVAFCIKGRVDVSGPLYNLLMGQDGHAYLLAAGKANNIGRTHKARIDLAIRAGMPLDRELGPPPADDYGLGNSVVLGFGFITPGAGPYSAVQYANGVKGCAALGHALGWSASDLAGSVAGHQECTSRKVDPRFDMGKFRRDVRLAFTLPTPSPKPAGVTALNVAGTAPLLTYGMRDPIAFKGGNYVRRVQALLGITTDGVYGATTAAAVKSVDARLLHRTTDGKRVDAALWERLYGIQG